MKSIGVIIACAIVFVLLVSGLACSSGKCVGDICTYKGKQPPYASSETDRASIHLVENPNAADPTWQRLETFLNTDNTDKETYDFYKHPCGVFAEELHNNAEAAGIRAAWVAINFSDGSEAHALNAFNTSDKGLVYIDCTGAYPTITVITPIAPLSNNSNTTQYQQDKIWGKASDWDKVAYLSIGQEYGLTSLSAMICPEYECYEAYKQQKAAFCALLDKYNQLIEVYNADVEAYSSSIAGKTFYYGSAAYRKAIDWYNKLKNEEPGLDAQSQVLDIGGDGLGAFWEPLGNVSHVNVYW